MNAKKWVEIWFSFLSFSLILIGVFNYLIDPMWIFSHTHPFNKLQRAFDERKLKSMYLKNNPKKYDTLLLGSSRTTYYNQNHFNNMKVFNYSVSGAKPFEFIDFIENFKRYNKLENLIIGFDFFGCMLRYRENIATRVNANRSILREVNGRNQLEHLLFNYLTLDMTKHSLINAYRSITNSSSFRSYNREMENIVQTEIVSSVHVSIKEAERLYPKNHLYIPNFSNILLDVRNTAKDANIIVFTTPISKTMLQVIYGSNGLLVNYHNWIKDLVDVYQKVYFTTYLNPLSMEYERYSRDGHHYYPFATTEIAKYLSNGVLSKDRLDITKSVTVITKENIDTFLMQQKEYAKTIYSSRR